MSTFGAIPVGKILGAVGIATGVLGAAALGGVTAQRLALRRRAAAAGTEGGDGYGALDADRSYSVVADDGVHLHVEEVGPVDAPLTVVFAHGWALRAGAWHFQRLAFAPPTDGGEDPADGAAAAAGPAGLTIRMVFYDQRSHGRSGRAAVGHSTMVDLAGDLRAVIATAAPEGPIVLVGHSMGGMALLTLLHRDPDLFAERVVGVGLISSSATDLRRDEFTRVLLSGSNPVIRLATSAAARYPTVLERSRAGVKDLVWLLTRSIGFARRDIPAALVDYLDEMISGTPFEVIADFAPTLLSFDQIDELPALSGIPTLILCGDQDRVTPLARSRAMADVLPDAVFVVVPAAGHMAILEAPEPVNDALRDLFERAAAFAVDRGAIGAATDRDRDPARQ